MKYILMMIVALMMFVSCGQQTKNSTAVDEQARTEKNQAKLINVQPPVSLDWSLEREQINKRTRLWNDKNKISYIYLISYGKVMAFYSVKGKVSSVNSQITNPQQVVRAHSQGVALVAIDSPAEDGSYGTNGDGIYFFCTDGTYVEWAGEYMLADKPLKLTTQPTLYREID